MFCLVAATFDLPSPYNLRLLPRTYLLADLADFLPFVSWSFFVGPARGSPAIPSSSSSPSSPSSSLLLTENSTRDKRLNLSTSFLHAHEKSDKDEKVVEQQQQQQPQQSQQPQNQHHQQQSADIGETNIPSILHALSTPHLEVLKHDDDDVVLDNERGNESEEDAKKSRQEIINQEPSTNEAEVLGKEFAVNMDEIPLNLLPEPKEAVEEEKKKHQGEENEKEKEAAKDAVRNVNDVVEKPEKSSSRGSIPTTAVRQSHAPTDYLKKRLVEKELSETESRHRRHRHPGPPASPPIDEAALDDYASGRHYNDLQHFVQLSDHLKNRGAGVGGGDVNYLVDYSVEEVPLPELHSLSGFESDYSDFTPDPSEGLRDFDYPKQIATFHSPHGFQQRQQRPREPLEQTASAESGVVGAAAGAAEAVVGGAAGGVGAAAGGGARLGAEPNGFDIALPNYVHPDFSLAIGEPQEPGLDYAHYYPYLNKETQTFYSGGLIK